MQPEYARKLRELIDDTRVEERHRAAFQDMYQRNLPVLSAGQIKYIDGVYNPVIRGVPYDNKAAYPLEFENCSAELIRDQGYFIVDNHGTKHGPPLTKKEASMIASWFNKVLPGLNGNKPKKLEREKPF
jgi:hypothetical protein